MTLITIVMGHEHKKGTVGNQQEEEGERRIEYVVNRRMVYIFIYI
jgi:hypothetical protein